MFWTKNNITISPIQKIFFSIKNITEFYFKKIKINLEFLKSIFYKKKKLIKNNFLKNSISKKINKVLNKNITYKNKINKEYTKKFVFKTKNILEKNLNCFYLRKSKFFNKGRYSRNRQIYRTGVYLCFYINIIAIYLLWFVFYKFTIKFTYLWWFFILFPASFIIPKSIKYNLLYYKNFFFYINCYINWLKNFFIK